MERLHTPTPDQKPPLAVAIHVPFEASVPAVPFIVQFVAFMGAADSVEEASDSEDADSTYMFSSCCQL